jgi:hypothetical protein
LRSVSDPTIYEPLVEFTCGDRSSYERDVNDVARELLELSSEDLAGVEVRVAEAEVDAQTAAGLIGVSVFFKKRLRTEPESETYADAVYIALLALGTPHRGCRLPDGVTRIGAFLLCDALAQIDSKWGDPMPHVWGVVHRDNAPSRKILAPRGFWPIGRKLEYPIYLRSEGLDWAHGFTRQTIEAVERASASYGVS